MHWGELLQRKTHKFKFPALPKNRRLFIRAQYRIFKKDTDMWWLKNPTFWSIGRCYFLSDTMKINRFHWHFFVDVYLLIYTLPDYARISWFFCFVTFKKSAANRDVSECPLVDKLGDVNADNTVEGCFSCLVFVFVFSHPVFSHYNCRHWEMNKIQILAIKTLKTNLNCNQTKQESFAKIQSRK